MGSLFNSSFRRACGVEFRPYALAVVGKHGRTGNLWFCFPVSFCTFSVLFRTEVHFFSF